MTKKPYNVDEAKARYSENLKTEQRANAVFKGQSLILCKPQIRLQNDNIIYVVFVV